MIAFVPFIPTVYDVISDLTFYRSLSFMALFLVSATVHYVAFISQNIGFVSFFAITLGFNLRWKQAFDQ